MSTKITQNVSLVQSWVLPTCKNFQSFLANPIEEDLITVPGIGHDASQILNSEGINNTWNLIGLFCYKFNRDPEIFLKYIDNVKEIKDDYKKILVKAITLKVALMFGDSLV